ncbi:hypothetical protein F5879DRAFT_220621 [Lentinula edodes]|uniref:uncharacterized protein n=1 Tax=Lentinula edodes TaxID=5353 RepID=UPI001E8D6130|nr:uncharacterized protein C8R40DRAFT_755834 [Lentinula edodes]KAH7869098.1 hypothetical protein C8R40DRAFT_755834 [Lentinula edodes]KAJ3902590.1 hypothetical protein F5879DRAFT_220621 [Lentinula edodes]KAJ3916401.1 hypothetical protein F5877DRAFT_80925 [Lentinula edodes]
MRFAAFVLLSAICGTSAEAIESLLRRGSTTEVCACISEDLRLDSYFGGRKVTAGVLEACICESEVSTFVAGNSVCKNGVDMIGKTVIEVVVTKLIKNTSNKQTCTFPEHSTPACTASNKCGFTCGDGYSVVKKNGQSTCACAHPKSVCNGKCASSCPSGRSLPEKRDHLHWGQQTQRTCRPGWAACGIAGGGVRQWECIDIKNDLESCGGCPMDVVASDGKPGLGVDCTIIPGVSDVSCQSGRCAVEKCMPGYAVSRDGRHCVPQEVNSSDSSPHYIHHFDNTPTQKGTLGGKIVAAAAAAFGIEHLPFSD